MYLFDQAPKQREQIVFRITDDLELVARWMPVAKLEGIESDPRPEQTGAKVKLVDFSGAIREAYRFELDVFESLQPVDLSHFHVETSATKLPVSAFDRAVVDDVIARCVLATTVAVDLLASRRLGWFHFQRV